MIQLWENDPLYNIGRKYVDSIIRLSYSKISEYQKENIPSGGAVLFAANHSNTLMDALVVLQSHKGPLAFGARADIFRKPKIAAALNWLRIVPLARQRDGAKAMEGNQAVFNKVVETLIHGVPFVIYPEGTHRTMHSLMPIKNGVFRIAIQACRTFEEPVNIVPVGIDYSDYFHYRQNVKIKFAEPIDVREALERNGNDERAAIADMQEILFRRLSESITYFPDDSEYESRWAEYLKAHTPKYSTAEKVLRNALGLVLLPLFALLAILSLIIWLPAELIVRKLKDKAWSNTVRFGVRLALTPLLLILTAVPAFILAPWYVSVPLVVLSYFSTGLFYDILNYYNVILHEK